METTKNIKQKLLNVLKKDENVYSFIEQLSTISELIFFGGSVRDLYLSDVELVYPRDFDIVLNSKQNYKQLEDFLAGYNYKKNRFGGYKIDVGNTEVDLWWLEKTWAFDNKIIEKSAENLIKSVYLSIDGIAFNYNKEILYDDVFDRTANAREINIVLKENPQESLNLLRGLIFKKKYNYCFSEQLTETYNLSMRRSENFVEHLYNLQLSHYKEEKLSLAEIKREMTLLNR